MSVDVEGKSLVELLAMLEPAPVPAPVSMTPQTLGWAVLAVLLAICIVAGLLTVLRHRRSNAYRRAALTELAAPGISATKSAEVLRRAALVAYPRRKIAGLYGDDWLKFLRQTSEKNRFPASTYQRLTEAPYKPTAPDPEVTALAKHWVKTHKRERHAR
ncbi:hypothetical protein RA28_14195 [Ruegeria sp. ANG-S4]|uniref:DUF4381 domain-containing protein n=1 Tax=Ruegeria sp. ANG-S4 TaxID=1577904 RepID=UPI00057C49C9|nr:DUF4381 domain-containing protein [Ruegeria sp. ANG-S4]KIC44127.1 hypothetical protein RA28_14195 [Ruegeria sp. ANG-S4]